MTQGAKLATQFLSAMFNARGFACIVVVARELSSGMGYHADVVVAPATERLSASRDRGLIIRHPDAQSSWYFTVK